MITIIHPSPYTGGRDATYNSVSHYFYWSNLSKQMHSWICRYPPCISFKTLQQHHSPTQVHLYQHPFHTLSFDHVGELPLSPVGDKWIVAAACPYSNFLSAILLWIVFYM